MSGKVSSLSESELVESPSDASGGGGIAAVTLLDDCMGTT